MHSLIHLPFQFTFLSKMDLLRGPLLVVPLPLELLDLLGEGQVGGVPVVLHEVTWGVCMYIHVHVHIHLHLHIHRHMHIHIHIYIYCIYIYTHTYTYTYTCTCPDMHWVTWGGDVDLAGPEDAPLDGTHEVGQLLGVQGLGYIYLYGYLYENEKKSLHKSKDVMVQVAII
jgi:hypothetical protein